MNCHCRVQLIGKVFVKLLKTGRRTRPRFVHVHYAITCSMQNLWSRPILAAKDDLFTGPPLAARNVFTTVGCQKCFYHCWLPEMFYLSKVALGGITYARVS